MKRTDWLILTILLLSPVIVNYIILCPSFGYNVSGTQDGWLSFYGALVGSLITMFVLYRTRKWNKDDNDETRKMQAKVLQYQAKRVWFENLRKQLDDNYRILDFQDATTAIKDIAAGNCQRALSVLMWLNKNIEMQGYTSDLYLPLDNLSKQENDYVSCYNNALKQYGAYINDMILICGIKLRMQERMPINDYINDFVSHLIALSENNKEVKPSPFLLSLAKALSENCHFKEIQKMCLQRIDDTSLIHSLKVDLSNVTKALLKYEESKIEQILN